MAAEGPVGVEPGQPPTRDQLGALKTAASEIHIDDDRFDLPRVLRRISDWKTRGVTPERARAELEQSAELEPSLAASAA